MQAVLIAKDQIEHWKILEEQLDRVTLAADRMANPEGPLSRLGQASFHYRVEPAPMVLPDGIRSTSLITVHFFAPLSSIWIAGSAKDWSRHQTGIRD